MTPTNSFTHPFEIIKICFTEIKITYKWSEAVAVTSSLFFLLALIYFFSISIGPNPLPTNIDLFVGTFFENLLLPQVVILIAWFVLLQKTNSGRLKEYKFLTSLPLTGRQIFSKFIVSDYLAYFWIPLAFSLLYLGLVSIAPYPFIARLILFTFLFHFLIQTLQIFSQLLVLSKTVTSGFNYLFKTNPMILILSLFMYEIGHLLFLFVAKEFSTVEFVFWAAGILFFCVFLVLESASLFLELHKKNFWHKTHRAVTEKKHSNRFLDLFYRSIKNPFLFKNLVSLSRSSSSLMGSILTLAFFAIAYLLAMNNRATDDILAVLFVCTVIYILLYNLVAINSLSEEQEPPKLLQSLPTKKSALYLSFLVPTAGWLIVVISVLTFWLHLRGVNFGTLLVFWSKLLISVIVANVISLNCGLGYYPNTNLSKNRYFMWWFFIVMFSVIFYEFTIWIALAISAVTFLELRKLKFFLT